MESPRSSSSNWIVWAAIAAVVACLCLIVIIAVGAVLYYRQNNGGLPLTLPSTTPTEESAPALNRPPAGTISQDTVNTLSSVLVPENDPYELACRLLSVCGVSPTI